ncbi:MAG TPA: Hpt domain-containing protein [Opitutaceae bacterium]
MNTNEEINWEQLALVIGDENDPGDEEMKDLYRLFVDDAGRRLGTLVSSVGTRERVFIAREAHKIRGAASSFGFDHVAEILRLVETQINDLSQERLDDMLRGAVEVFQASIRGVARKFPGLAA